MAVEVDGDGDPIVMVHGLGGTTNTWTPLLPAVSNFKRIRVELPGSGRSHRAHVLQENTAHKGQLSIDVLVDAVLRVCSQLGVSRAHFAGHSLGTIVCQHLAVRAPERVRSLALFGALLAPPDAARQGLKARAAKARDEGMFGIADAIVQAALSSSTREQLPVAVAFVRESLCAQDAEGYARTCEALAAAQPASIENIDVPMLLVAGDEDAVAPAQVAREIAGRTTDARIETLSRCGHWMPVERPIECQSHLRRFLERARAAA
ncbi:MAG: alpha/beta fold hydrolase [Burkholderiaceae bacterium]